MIPIFLYFLIFNSTQFEYISIFKPYKKILILNEQQRLEIASFGTGHQSFINANCPVKNCEIVVNSTFFWLEVLRSKFRLLEKFDAIVLSYSYIPPEPISDEYQRPRNQRFVFLSQESPVTMDLELKKVEYQFNWTMTYRRNADIPFLYGRIHKNTNDLPSKGQLFRSFKKKKKTGSLDGFSLLYIKFERTIRR